MQQIKNLPDGTKVKVLPAPPTITPPKDIQGT